MHAACMPVCARGASEKKKCVCVCGGGSDTGVGHACLRAHSRRPPPTHHPLAVAVVAVMMLAVGTASAVIPANVKVLLVDDSAALRRIERSQLNQLGFRNVNEATDGSTALQMLRTGGYGLVVSGWNMEPMTGLQLLREVRVDSQLAGTPFLMVTAESRTENEAAAKAAGVSNTIVKPFNTVQLKTKLVKMLGIF